MIPRPAATRAKPSGAYAPRFAPYLAEGANTWGRSLNLDGPLSDGVRRIAEGVARDLRQRLAALRSHSVSTL